MSSNERLPQKSSTRGMSRKTGTNNAIPVNTSQNSSIRDTQYPDEEFLLMEDDPYASNPPRPPSSAIRLNKPSTIRRSSRDVTTETSTRRPTVQNVPPRRTQQKQDFGQLPPVAARPARTTTASYDIPAQKKERRNIHWMLYVGLGMIGALLLFVLGASVLNWGMNKYNDIIYGNPRTFQTDAIVGHNDNVRNPSHFIAVNLHGQVIIVEFPGGDPSKAIDYIGPALVGPGDDLLPVTLTFSDMNHDSRLDMVVHIADRSFVFYNQSTKDGLKFVAPSSNTTPTPTPGK